MTDEKKQTEEKAKNIVKENKKELEKIQQVEESPSTPEVKNKDTKSEKQKEKEVETLEIKEEETKSKEPETLKQEEKAAPAEPKKDQGKPAKKKDEKKGDFKYIVRIANTDLDGEKNVVFGLAQIKGIGRHMAVYVANAAGIDRNKKIGDLTDVKIEKIKEILGDLDETAPSWMLNYRKDLDTGKDNHLISADVDMRLRDDINLLKMIRSYRGIRHESGLRVRGQRTRANSRKGLALGVSKKRPQG